MLFGLNSILITDFYYWLNVEVKIVSRSQIPERDNRMKSMIKVISTAVILVTITACSTKQAVLDETKMTVNGKAIDEKTLAEAKAKSGYRCVRVKATGTRLKKKQCSTAKQRKIAKERAAQILNENREINQVSSQPTGQ